MSVARPRKESALVTVAALREGKRPGDRPRCLFHERQQIFEIRSADAHASLQGAYEKEFPVKATLDPHRGVVERITSPSEREWAAFDKSRVLLDAPEKPQRVTLSSLDPTTFNIVDYYLRSRLFGLCTRVIPSYKTAKAIFDFCAEQSCSLPGPTVIAPCIPFQYVIDGCYARAHKMRQIIDDRYGYCCEKVFSFANQGNDELAVVASKWGGCCVTWWYHVAPLVRVRIQIRLGSVSLSAVLAFVIDPGMFDKPVLLSSWLAAQANKVCSSDANVSMYAIEPGSAYTPANFQGAAFTTDPTYSATDATLTAYRNFTTC